MSGVLSIDSGSLEDTHRLGRRLGAALRPGDVVGLIGPLGSGKTTLVKGIAAGAGVADLRQVNSPTFVIVNEYDVAPAGQSNAEPLRIYHIDVYRLRGSEDLDAIGFDEMCRSGAVIVEWADRVLDLMPEDRLDIRIDPLSDSARRFHCEATSTNAARLGEALTPDVHA